MANEKNKNNLKWLETLLEKNVESVAFSLIGDGLDQKIDKISFEYGIDTYINSLIESYEENISSHNIQNVFISSNCKYQNLRSIYHHDKILKIKNIKIKKSPIICSKTSFEVAFKYFKRNLIHKIIKTN